MVAARDRRAGGRRRAGRHRRGARRGRRRRRGGPRRALRLPRRQRHRGAGDAADVVPHPARGASSRPGGARLFPTDHGPGEPVVAGVLARLLEPAGRERRRDRARRSRPATSCRSTPSCSSSPRSSCSTRRASTLLFHAFASGVVDDGGRAGRRVRDQVRADRDPRPDRSSTAPAMATSPRAPARRYEIGREQDGLVQPMTLMFRMVEFQRGGVRGLRARAPRPVARRARPVGPGPRGDARRRARPAARGHPVLRHAARARGQRQQHAGHRRARDRRVRLEPGRDRRAAASCARSRRSCAATCRASRAPTSPRAACIPACARPAGSSATIG